MVKGCGKIFSDDDQMMIFYIVEYVFPLLQCRDKVKWLMSIIQTNYKWNGFFNNYEIRRRKNEHNYHLNLLKIVSNKKKLINDIVSMKRYDDRKRKSKTYEFIMWRMGNPVIKHTQEDVELIEKSIGKNFKKLHDLFYSNNCYLLTHFFLVLGSFYRKFNKNHNMKFYFFVDTVINNLLHNRNEIYYNDTYK